MVILRLNGPHHQETLSCRSPTCRTWPKMPTWRYLIGWKNGPMSTCRVRFSRAGWKTWSDGSGRNTVRHASICCHVSNGQRMVTRVKGQGQGTPLPDGKWGWKWKLGLVVNRDMFQRISFKIYYYFFIKKFMLFYLFIFFIKWINHIIRA